MIEPRPFKIDPSSSPKVSPATVRKLHSVFSNDVNAEIAKQLTTHSKNQTKHNITMIINDIIFSF